MFFFDLMEFILFVLFVGDEFEVEEYEFVVNSIVLELVDIFYDIGVNFGGYLFLVVRCGVM